MADAVAEPSRALVARMLQLVAEPGMQLEAVGADRAVILGAGGGRRIVLIDFRDDGDAMQARLDQVVRARDPLPVDVVLIGGPASASAMLQKAKPFVTTARRYLYHLPDDGPLWHDRSGPTHPLLLREPPVVDAAAIESFHAAQAGRAAAAEAEREALDGQRAELQTFIGRHQATRPLVTYAVLGLIGCTLAMQLAFGGIDSDPVLVRLGALSPVRVHAGEVWRLASCTFLHASIPHVVMNCWVLFALGAMAERIIGSWRFLLLYCVSALAGSAASLLRLDDMGLSVGASGALWGCLGAHAVLAYRSDGLLPEAMVPGARRAALTNLGLNLFVSFLPRVDWAAHLAGGAAGALLTFALLRRGLPRLRDVAPRTTGAVGGPPVDRRPFYIAPLAVFSAAVLLGGLAVGVLRGRAWELRDPPRYARETLPALGVSLEVPRDLSVTDPELLETNIGEVGFGDIRADPVLIGVVRFEGPEHERDVEAARAEVREELRAPNPDLTVVQEPVDAELAAKPAVRARYRYKNGLERSVFLVFGSAGAIHRVEVYVHPGFPTWAEVPDHVVQSLRFGD